MNSITAVGYGKSWFCISKSVENSFKSYLKRTNMNFHPYQLEGVKWCVYSETNDSPLYGVRGGFLADEMGLGKTIMMIGTFVCNYLPRTLIVVPVILIEQWYNQIYKTTGHKAVIFHGTSKKRYSLEVLEKATIVITTYAHISLKKDKEKDKDEKEKEKEKEKGSLLHDIQWDRIVFDEAHHLRNKGTGKHDGSHLLKTDIIWFISGTPIQNRRKDFYHLCSILKIPSASYTDDIDGIPGIIERFVLRRTKKEVGIECGELNSLKCHVNWKAKNEMLFSKNIHSYLSINKELREALVSTTSKKEVVQGEALHLDNKTQLELYIRAKQLCILPNLIGKRFLGKELWKANYTSKIDAVVDFVLSKRLNGNGKLIFCTYRYEMDTLANKLTCMGDDGFEKEKILIFDGRLSNAARKKSLANLSLYSVIIIQIQTGCEGLNLQDYFNEVYFVSPNWNPCIEDQAIARCHRIGQSKKVFVYKFEMLNEVVSDNFMSLISLLPLDVKRLIVDYVPVCNFKWINMDEYIVSVQGMKREIIREFIY